MLSIIQILRIVWAYKWVSMLLFAVIAGAGSWVVLQMPPRYYAQTSLLIDVRPDPILGTLGHSFNMAGQMEVLQSDKVALRATELLGTAQDPGLVEAWQRVGTANMPFELFAAHVLRTGLRVESSRAGSQILIGYLHEDPAFAARAANAYAQAAIDVSAEMSVATTRESATFLDEQSRLLRQELERAQSQLTQFQRKSGISVTDERVSQEATRLTALQAQLAAAEAERLDASPDVQQDEQVREMRRQVSAAETRLREVSSVIGVNHPQRRQLEAELASLRQQLAAEVSRASSSTAAASRASNQKVQELRALVEAQNRRVLSMRSDYDQVAVLQRDVEAAQRAYDMLRQRGGQVNLQSQADHSMLRLMTPALEPAYPSRKRMLVALLGVLAAGFVVGVGVPFGLELLDRRVRGVEDLLGEHGVPVLGVLRPARSKAPALRHVALARPRFDRPGLTMSDAAR